ncbi:MAG: B12-binding domain-containing radical SAM protein [Thermoguttaceae bacterium]
MKKTLEIVYIAPSRYDDEGYVKRYIWGVVPSNSLAVLRSLTESLAAEKPFPGVDIRIRCYDDCVQKIPFKKIAKLNSRPDTKVVVGLVGVQTGQFPRAAEIAVEFKKLGVDSMIGGFHVSGVLALFGNLTPELQELVDQGVTLICGESETPGVLRDLYADALNDNLKPIYTFPKAPSIEDVPLPQADPLYLKHFGAKWATIDSSRGCPYGCSFCTVINVQGRKMRCRTAENVLNTIRSNYEKGAKRFFFTDDNFARNKVWSEILDGIIEMRKEGKNIGFMMQVDTKSSKIPNFVEKAKEAGCSSVFIGMESVNPENLKAAGKVQNSVDEYREMVRKWQSNEILVHVGYIIGFPHDTLESVKSDVQFLRDHVGVDLASFFMLTPLPGSVDHYEMVQRGDELDPDLNNYDSFHAASKHPKMTAEEWNAATKLAYSEFYTKEHCTTILRRVARKHYWLMFWNLIWYRYSGVFSGTHPMMTGFFRVKNRLERRPGQKKEGLFRFAARWAKEFVLDAGSYTRLFFEFQEIWFLTRKPEVLSLQIQNAELQNLELQNVISSEGNEEQTQLVIPLEQVSQKTSPGSDWNALTQLRLRWSALQERIAQYNWSGRCDTAIQEIRGILTSTAQALKNMKQSFGSKLGRAEKKQAELIEEVVNEIEEQITAIETSPPDKSLLYETQDFVNNKLISRYEELTHRYVRSRRLINRWRDDALAKIKKGRVFSSVGKTLFRAPAAAVLETYLSVRFSVAAMRKEL